MLGSGLELFADDSPTQGFRPLFDGKTLAGWHPMPRPGPKPPDGGKDGSQSGKPGEKTAADSFYERSLNSRGRWTVRDGIIIGEQDPPGSGLGGYIVSDEAFEDFELLIDAKPDWPADTGVLVRTAPAGNVGFQVLLDHRPHGGIGGYFGNGLWNFHSWAYGFMAEKDKDGRLVRLIPQKPSEPSRGNTTIPLDFAAPPETFLRIWKVDGWNQFRIRSVGALPRLTTWINGEKISELDTAKIHVPGYSPEAVLDRIGRAGHISLEVHDNAPGDPLGKDRWAPGAVCRWRNIFIQKLSR
ncbi:MAG: DUF1080 domain-containing protein [Verrucomicrobiota bacterium]|jgi:hypothetical protein